MLGSVKKAVFRVLCLGALCLCGGLMAEQDPKELIFSGITIYTDKNFTRAKKYFEKACKLNNAEGCMLSAAFYDGVIKGFKKDKKAFKYYSKACELNYGDGCEILGDIYHHGEGVTQNFKKAFQYYSKACELNEALTCTFVGAFYRVV